MALYELGDRRDWKSEECVTWILFVVYVVELYTDIA